VKCVRRRALPEHERKALNAEMDIMLRLSHPNILKLLDSFKDREHLYMVVELARGGELFDRIVQKVCHSNCSEMHIHNNRARQQYTHTLQYKENKKRQCTDFTV
jgi:serine/threonine protein kinase